MRAMAGVSFPEVDTLKAWNCPSLLVSNPIWQETLLPIQAQGTYGNSGTPDHLSGQPTCGPRMRTSLGMAKDLEISRALATEIVGHCITFPGPVIYGTKLFYVEGDGLW